MTRTLSTDVQAAACAALRVFIVGDQVCELRALKVGASARTRHGFYDADHLSLMAEHAAELDADGAKGVYFTPNPIDPAKTAGRLNPARPLAAQKGDAAADADVLRRHWLLIDVDPVKAEGHADDSATDGEKAGAREILGRCKAALDAEGFVGGVVGDSGNGWNLNYPIDLPNDDETRETLRTFLRELGERCDGPGGRVDRKTYNAARIWKLFGTTARKGIATEDRPHRQARLVEPFARPSDGDAAANDASLRRLLAEWAAESRAKARQANGRLAGSNGGAAVADGARRVERARKYLDKIEPAVSGEHGHDATFRVACKLVEFGLTRAEAEQLLRGYSERCKPPWSDSELRHKLDGAFDATSPDPKYTTERRRKARKEGRPMVEQVDAVRLVSERGGNGKVKVTARWQGQAVHIDTLDPASASGRRRFINALKEKLPQGEAVQVEAELLRIADAAPAAATTSSSDGDGDVAAAMLDKMPKDIRDDAAAMLADPALIQAILADVEALGVAGERELTATVYLIGTSRLLDRPLAGIVQGPSASGKSFIIEQAAALFPPEAVVIATQMTPQALFHMKAGSLTHRFVVAGERSRLEDDERAEATRALREMLSSGRLSKLMPVKAEGGRIETQLIEQEGPIAFVESTTLSKVFDEDANRCILVHTDERERQTARIISSLAAGYRGGVPTADASRIVQRHHPLQRLLRRQAVVIPFADRLGELFPSDRVEARRAFPQLMSMIQAVTLLHQYQRIQDGAGRLLATADDYRHARRLLVKPMGRLLGGRLSDPARRCWERLSSKWATQPFTTTEAKKHETGSKSSVYGWLKELHEAGMVQMTEPPRGSSPATWRLVDGGPGEGAALTLPEWNDVASPCSARKPGHDAEPVAAL